LEVGLGTVDVKALTNVVIDALIEFHSTGDGFATNAERRLYYYGTDLPDACVIGPLFETPSPCKRLMLESLEDNR
jgi:hypothetical protein